MKLHLPSILLTLVAIPFTTYTASADVIGKGVCYDLGKAYYSTDATLDDKRDKSYCWAAGASNIIQYWQDTYYNTKDASKDVPTGTNATYGSPMGTMYLNVYQEAYKNGVGDNFSGGYPRYLLDWWMTGKQEPNHLLSGGGYYTNVFGSGTSATGTFYATFKEEEKPDAVCVGENPQAFRGVVEKSSLGVPGNNEAKWKDLSAFIIAAFSVQGRSLAVDINTTHIITCWGYEANAEGLVTSLILSDSDDAAFGTFRAQIYIGDTDAADYGYNTWVSQGQRLMITTDDQSELSYSLGFFGEGKKANWLTSFSYIDTPTDKLAPKVAPSSVLPLDVDVTSNVCLTENKAVLSSGVIVGDGLKAVVLTSERGKTLSLDGQDANRTGLQVKDGAMVSLFNVEIANYQNSGVESIGKTYFHDGEVSIHDNATEGDGGAVKNTNYLEFMDCERVSITGNTSEGQGGAISNTAGSTVSIRGNKEVEFSGNKATGGANDIYNGEGSYLNIADNDSVVFKGEGGKAIVNDGALYLRAKDGQKITFDNAALISDKGTVYVGKDIAFRDNNVQNFYVFDTNEGNAGKVEFKDGGNYTSLQTNPNQDSTYATLEKLSVSANAIVGAGDEGGTVSNALITSLGGLTLSNLKLDTTNTINSLGVAYTELDNVVLTLTDADRDGNMFDLTDVLTGNLTLTKLTFDLSQTSLGEADLKNLSFDLSKAFAEQQQIMNINFVLQGKTYDFVQADSSVYFASNPLPEPTTGTLSLLALCALAARRHRRK